MFTLTLLAAAVLPSQTTPLDAVPKSPAPIETKNGRHRVDNSHLPLAERIARDARLAEFPFGGGGEQTVGREGGAQDAPTGLFDEIARSAREHFQLDVGPDGTLWAFGGTYKASFEEEGATFIPFLGSRAPRNFPLRFGAPEVLVDGTKLELDVGASPEFAGDAAVFDRGLVTERYDLRVGEMEQLFVLHDGTRRGEVEVRIPVESELVGRVDGDALLFEGPCGGVSYSYAIAIDANGARCSAPTALETGAIVLRVPAAFVHEASFPLTIDPVVASFGVPNDAVTDDKNPDLAYDRSTGHWIIALQRDFSSTDQDIWTEYYDEDGDRIAGTGTYVDLSSIPWQHPKVANNAWGNQFLIVATRTGSNDQIWGRARQAMNNAMSIQFPISQSPFPCSWPDVGGDATATGTSYCVVWETAISTGADHDIHGRLVNTSQNTGTLIAVDDTNGTYDKFPSISTTAGTDTGEGEIAWNVSWQREFQADDWDIYGSRVARNSSVDSPSFRIDFGTVDTRWPDSSTSLDGYGVESAREWMCVYELEEADDVSDVRATVLRGRSILGRANVSTFLGAFEGQDQFRPCVDTNGNAFAVAWSQRWQSSFTNFDIVGVTLYHAGGVIRKTPILQTMGGGPQFDFTPEVSARRSEGFFSSQCGFVWGSRDLGINDSDVRGSIWGIENGYGNFVGSYYCDPVVNSTGVTAQLHVSGSRHAGTDPLAVSAYRLPLHVNAYFLGSPNPGSSYPASSSGRVCLGNPLSRFNAANQIKNSGSTGRITLQIDTNAIPLPTGGTTVLMAGQVFRFQCWYRDGATNNLTNGVSVLFL